MPSKARSHRASRSLARSSPRLRAATSSSVRSYGVAALSCLFLLPGCRAALGVAAIGTVAAVRATQVTGYTIYRAGSAVVSVAGSAGSAVRDKVAAGHHAIVISRGTLEMRTPHSVEALRNASVDVLNELGFTGVRAHHDALSGTVRATSAAGELIAIDLELLETGVTELRILIGEGRIEQSEFVAQKVISRCQEAPSTKEETS